MNLPFPISSNIHPPLTLVRPDRFVTFLELERNRNALFFGAKEELSEALEKFNEDNAHEESRWQAMLERELWATLVNDWYQK